jgi:hypothetical protein
MAYTSLQVTTIILFLAILAVWGVSICYKSEQSWALNPWLPTTVGALVWSVWLNTSERY